jgi:hypothetical protein
MRHVLHAHVSGSERSSTPGSCLTLSLRGGSDFSKDPAVQLENLSLGNNARLHIPVHELRIQRERPLPRGRHPSSPLASPADDTQPPRRACLPLPPLLYPRPKGGGIFGPVYKCLVPPDRFWHHHPRSAVWIRCHQQRVGFFRSLSVRTSLMRWRCWPPLILCR